MARSFYVTCPCCKTLLEVEAETGEVVKKWAPKAHAEGQDKMDAALKELEEGKKRREGLFDKTKEGLDAKKKKLDDAFRQQVDKIKKEGLGDKPRTPFDLD